jgi:hypothetical protein
LTRGPASLAPKEQRGPGSSPGRRFDFSATGPGGLSSGLRAGSGIWQAAHNIMAAGVATSGHCVVPLLAEDMGGPVGACAHNLVGWSCGGWPRALPRHFCICIHFGPFGRACLQCRTFSLHPFGLSAQGLRLLPGLWVGALAHGWYPCPSPLRPCLRGTAHGCGLAFHPLGCCPCHCAQSIAVKARPGGFGGGDALRNLRSLICRAWGCPRARGALAGVSALAGGRFRRRLSLVFTSPPVSPSLALQPHHFPISIPTQGQEYASSMAVTASFRWHFCRRQFPATHGWSHRSGESSK